MKQTTNAPKEDRFWNPYVAGAALGVVLFATFFLMGKGLGASGAANRLGAGALAAVAPAHVSKNPTLAPLASKSHILDNWLIFEVLGVFLGGAVAAYSAGRMKKNILRGPRISVRSRILLAVFGGTVMGIAARLARGCTSGQALSGGALLSVGSWLFMLSIFAGAYAMAYFVRRQWT